MNKGGAEWPHNLYNFQLQRIQISPASLPQPRPSLEAPQVWVLHPGLSVLLCLHTQVLGNRTMARFHTHTGSHSAQIRFVAVLSPRCPVEFRGLLTIK
jgi:hypothetical protein